MKSVTLQIAEKDFELLTELARQSMTSPERWASEAVESALAEKRGYTEKFYRPAGEKVLK